MTTTTNNNNTDNDPSDRITRVKPYHPFIGGDLEMTCVSEVNRADLISHGVSIEMKGPATDDQRSEVSVMKVREGRTPNSKEIERFVL